MSYEYQVVVIGSGSAGREACLSAAKAGLRTLLVEERDLGGTSLHAGSYAVRALRACASYLQQTGTASKVGISLDLIETTWADWLSTQRRSSNQIAVEFSRAIDREKVDLQFGRARLNGPDKIIIADAGGQSRQVTASHLILATGSRPGFPSQPEFGILNSDHLLGKPVVPRHLFVVGGGYIGCELAAIYRELGARVTLAEAESRLLPSWDTIAGEQFRTVLEAAGVEVLLNEPIQLPPQITGSSASYKLSTGRVIQPNTTLVATGRIPNSDDLGLESVGLKSGDWISVNEKMQTPIESVYAVGDVNGIALLDSVAAAQADVAVRNILGKAARFDKRWFPEFLHSEPPIASIGWTEDEAKAAGLQVKALAWNGPLFTDNDLSSVQREQMAIKCLLDAETDRIMGCLAIGSRAAEIINLVSTAMASRLSARELANLSVVHPSATEVLVRILRQNFDHPISSESAEVVPSSG
jgi:pyruvate/2-oxoglutarate dehydrogenase complex dihydrolipoamide dehydrogenase (E3) component